MIMHLLQRFQNFLVAQQTGIRTKRRGFTKYSNRLFFEGISHLFDIMKC